MAQPLYALDDYKAALRALLPRGRAWPRDPDSVQAAVINGLAPSFVRLDARAQGLLADAFPATTLELLPEWEASLGLPDQCEGPNQGLEQRRTQVVSRLVNTGGQSVGYYLGVIARLGYVGVTIDEFAPFRADRNTADSPLYDSSWWMVWRINIPDFRVFYFQADISAADEALLTIANDVILCVIPPLAPAHTTVIFATA
jgi:uncharacterized protein YmfQ (DUF2313 family)